MNPVSGRIAEIYLEDGSTRARVNVGGAQYRVLMTLLMDARVGDEVLIDSGVAISRIQSLIPGASHVLGDSR